MRKENCNSIPIQIKMYYFLVLLLFCANKMLFRLFCSYLENHFNTITSVHRLLFSVALQLGAIQFIYWASRNLRRWEMQIHPISKIKRNEIMWVILFTISISCKIVRRYRNFSFNCCLLLNTFGRICCCVQKLWKPLKMRRTTRIHQNSVLLGNKRILWSSFPLPAFVPSSYYYYYDYLFCTNRWQSSLL